MSCFPEPIRGKNRIKAELDLANYATKSDFENATGADTSESPKRTDLASLKPEVDKLDINKLEKVPTGLNNLKSKLYKLDVYKPVPVDLKN